MSYSRHHDLLTTVGLLVTLACVRRLAIGSHLWAGAPCSSFIWMSRGTTRRCRLRPRGSRMYATVKKANRFVRRLCMVSLDCTIYRLHQLHLPFFCIGLSQVHSVLLHLLWLFLSSYLYLSEVGVCAQKGLLLDNRTTCKQPPATVWSTGGLQ